KGKTELQDAFDAIAGFRDLVNETFEKLTGKPIAAWLREFQQQPKELPGEEQATDQQPTMPLADAYAILGLKPDAPLEDAKKHYRQLANVFHTDKGGMNDEAMKLINRAYERITKGKGEN
ncbi:unnamed protein product, partial [marine sediment metagenome]